jgi:hypothetical protein
VLLGCLIVDHGVLIASCCTGGSQVTKREAAKERPEGSEPPTIYAGPYNLHHDKTHLNAMGNYVLSHVYMSLGNYFRAFIGKQRKGYVLVAFLPVTKPEAFANGWTKNSPQYK